MASADQRLASSSADPPSHPTSPPAPTLGPRPSALGPATSRRIEAWFAIHQRALPWRERYDPYEVWVSEVMLQQTRMEVVLGYFGRFLTAFPTVESLAAASEGEVTALWSGLGYYRRARMLRDGARFVVQHFAGRLPLDVALLQSIPGIGRYTAGAIASIAYHLKAPIVDGNVARIIARIDAIDAPLGTPALLRASWQRAAELVEQSTDARALNQGLMELGALVCKPRNPDCPQCPLKSDCLAFQAGRTDAFPVAAVKKATRSLVIALYIVTDDRGHILMRIEKGPLMRSMYHLPHDSNSLLTGEPLIIPHPRQLGSFRHVVTDRRIRFNVFSGTPEGRVREGADQYAWIDPKTLDAIPHPSYVRKALALYGEAAVVE